MGGFQNASPFAIRAQCSVPPRMYPARKYAMISGIVAKVRARARTSAKRPSSVGVQLSHCLPMARLLYVKSMPYVSFVTLSG